MYVTLLLKLLHLFCLLGSCLCKGLWITGNLVIQTLLFLMSTFTYLFMRPCSISSLIVMSSVLSSSLQFLQFLQFTQQYVISLAAFSTKLNAFSLLVTSNSVCKFLIDSSLMMIDVFWFCKLSKSKSGCSFCLTCIKSESKLMLYPFLYNCITQIVVIGRNDLLLNVLLILLLNCFSIFVSTSYGPPITPLFHVGF